MWYDRKDFFPMMCQYAAWVQALALTAVHIETGWCPFALELFSKTTYPKSMYEYSESVWISSILFMIVEEDKIYIYIVFAQHQCHKCWGDTLLYQAKKILQKVYA